MGSFGSIWVLKKDDLFRFHYPADNKNVVKADNKIKILKVQHIKMRKGKP